MHVLFSLLASGLLAAPSPLAPSEEGGPSWPQWRGPRRDGVSLETDWVSAGKAEARWSAQVGWGYSSVAVVDGLLYTKGYDPDEGLDILWCLDAETGAVVWDFVHEARATPSVALDEGHQGGTNSTPSIGSGRLFSLARDGFLSCHDARSGDPQWELDLTRDRELTLPTWGFAASPLVLEDGLFVNVGRVLALDPETGAERWTSRDYGHAYATPSAFEHGSTPALAVFNSDGLAVLDRADGTQLAFREWRTRYDINAASPLLLGDRIHISSGQGRGNTLLRLADGELETVWENKHMGTKMSGCVRVGAHLYGFHETLLRCLSLDGEVRWTHRGLGYGALMAAGERLILLDDSGNLLIARATPERFELLSETKVLDGGTYWTRPVLVNGLIYCRNSLGHLVCRDHR